MMKKKVNIVLIVLVLILWGTLSYQFINKFFSNAGGSEVSDVSKFGDNQINIVRDTFDLIPLSRDPFLEKLTVSYPDHNKKSFIKRTGKRKKAEPVNSNVVWPDIRYRGFIKSNKSAQLALIIVNNQLVRLHLDHTSHGITIKKIYKDSIAVQYNKQIRIYKK